MKASRSFKGVMIFGAAALALMGCARFSLPEAELSAQNISQIVGGENAVASDPGASSTVGIWLIRPNSVPGGKSDTITCTGTLIGPNTVLTAAHCQNPQFPLRYIVFGPNFNGAYANPDEQLREITNFKVHPTWIPDPNVAAADKVDLAVLHFAGALPIGYKPAAIYRGFKPAAGTSLLVMGYGLSDVSAQDSGTLRKATTEVIDVELFSGFRIKGGDGKEVEQTSNPVAALDLFALNDSKQGICIGDSGGPAYSLKDKDVLLVGVTTASYGSSSPRSKSPACHAFSTHTLVSPYLEWINDAQNSFLEN